MPTPANILVVDDEPSMLRYIQTLLELESYRVDTAADGPEGVRRLQEGTAPDLVLLDVLMPGMDGLETLQKLREIQPQLKVIMLSCVSDTRKVVQAIRSGAQDYLTKPFQKADLQQAMEQVLGRSAAAAAKFVPGE